MGLVSYILSYAMVYALMVVGNAFIAFMIVSVNLGLGINLPVNKAVLSCDKLV